MSNAVNTTVEELGGRISATKGILLETKKTIDRQNNGEN